LLGEDKDLELPIWIMIAIGICGIGFAYYLVRYVMGCDQGSDAIRNISAAIKEGANAFLKRQYILIRRHQGGRQRLS